MERNEFLAKLGISLAAVCTSCSLSSCGSKDADPTPDPPKGNGALLSINLDSEMKNVGEFKVANGIILVRLASGNTMNAFSAVQVACTHQGSAINYNASQGKFICPNHGSQFNTSGGVLVGPAATSLKKYAVAVKGSSLTVTA